MWALIEINDTTGINILMVSTHKIDLEFKLNNLSDSKTKNSKYYIRQTQEYNINLQG